VPDLTLGIAAVLAGGILNGSWVLPMKRLTGWRWENTWLVFSVLGLLVIPWTVTVATVPGLGAVLAATSGATLAKVLVFGFGWGLGNILFGLGVSRLGLGLGYGIILGLIAPIGTFLPLALQPERLWTRQGLALVIGTLLVVVGIVASAVAGRRREQQTAGPASTARADFAGGLAICIASGVLSSLLNLAFAFGEEIRAGSAAAGAAAAMSPNAVMALALSSGFIANFAYAAYLLGRNRTWSVFSAPEAPGRYWGSTALMGLLMFAGFLAYGSGATALGRLGWVLGWPLFMSMSVITSNVWGALTGEWRGAGSNARRYALVGTAFFIAAIVVVAAGGSE
jgi:L-rhamnose-H+ transport protein